MILKSTHFNLILDFECLIEFCIIQLYCSYVSIIKMNYADYLSILRVKKNYIFVFEITSNYQTYYEFILNYILSDHRHQDVVNQTNHPVVLDSESDCCIYYFLLQRL